MTPRRAGGARATPRGLVAACVMLATFTDLVAYSIAIPLLPDYARRFGASPATIGQLFGAFGVTLLAVSIPMGAVSDRVGRRGPLVLATLLLAASTVWFGLAASLPMLFGARLLQGVADGVTWVVGFALLADLYGPEERGPVMGATMSAASLGIIIGPSIGGWLYEWGGIRLPFFALAAVAVVNCAALVAVRLPPRAPGVHVSMRRVLSHRAIVLCAVTAAAGSATFAMLEPVLPLVLDARFGFGPTQIGLLFGTAALVSGLLHPAYGWLSDRWGGARLMRLGLIVAAIVLPGLPAAAGWRSSAVAMVAVSAALGLVVTPSLTYMAAVASAAGLGSFGVVYGLYNVAWGVGLMVGPVAGGVLLERVGFLTLTLVWSFGLLVVAGLVAAAGRIPSR